MNIIEVRVKSRIVLPDFGQLPRAGEILDSVLRATAAMRAVVAWLDVYTVPAMDTAQRFDLDQLRDIETNVREAHAGLIGMSHWPNNTPASLAEIDVAIQLCNKAMDRANYLIRTMPVTAPRGREAGIAGVFGAAAVTIGIVLVIVLAFS